MRRALLAGILSAALAVSACGTDTHSGAARSTIPQGCPEGPVYVVDRGCIDALASLGLVGCECSAVGNEACSRAVASALRFAGVDVPPDSPILTESWCEDFHLDGCQDAAKAALDRLRVGAGGG